MRIRRTENMMNDLDDETLWAIAREQMPPEQQPRLAVLIDRNSQGTLTKREYKELETLWGNSQRLKLRKAEAMRLLMERGYEVSLEDLEQIVNPREVGSGEVSDSRPTRRTALRILSVFLVVIGVAFSPFICFYLAAFLHDNYPQKSNLSALDSEDEVQTALENELVIGQSSMQDVLEYLDKHDVEKCDISSYGIDCSIPTRSPILGTGRGYLLLTEEDYLLSFRFTEGKLALIKVRYVSTGL